MQTPATAAASTRHLPHTRTDAVVLGILALAFLARVLGQIVVGLFAPSFLPPWQEWESGLLPYPILLLSQLFILAFQLEVSRQLWRGNGPLTVPRPAVARWLKWFSLVYFLSMAARYAMTMTIYPERRWLGDVIPIVFHRLAHRRACRCVSRCGAVGYECVSELARRPLAPRRVKILPGPTRRTCPPRPARLPCPP